MLTPYEFDYDLWTSTDENKVKHYWARMKKTGEVTEVSHEVMKFLRSEEKKIRREYNNTPESGTVLSYDVPHDDEKSSWLEDRNYSVIAMDTMLANEEFRQLLTPVQLDVYIHCILNGETASFYAARHGITTQGVSKVVLKIREKAKKYFFAG